MTKHKVKYDPTKHLTHKDLIDLVDQALLFQFFEKYTKYDSARIKSLSGNGTMTWTDVAQDEHYGCVFSNQQSVLAK